MASVWGGAWGSAWGSSWGATQEGAGGGGYGDAKRKRRFYADINGKRVVSPSAEAIQRLFPTEQAKEEPKQPAEVVAKKPTPLVFEFPAPVIAPELYDSEEEDIELLLLMA